MIMSFVLNKINKESLKNHVNMKSQKGGSKKGEVGAGAKRKTKIKSQKEKNTIVVK